MNLETTTLYKSIEPRYPELAGKVAVVTGSARGIAIFMSKTCRVWFG